MPLHITLFQPDGKGGTKKVIIDAMNPPDDMSEDIKSHCARARGQHYKDIALLKLAKQEAQSQGDAESETEIQKELDSLSE